MQDAAQIIEEMADPEANIIFGTSRDPRLDDEVKMTMVAAAFPVLQDTQQMREWELQRLLQDVAPQSDEELDVPSFLRRHSTGLLGTLRIEDSKPTTRTGVRPIEIHAVYEKPVEICNLSYCYHGIAPSTIGTATNATFAY